MNPLKYYVQRFRNKITGLTYKTCLSLLMRVRENDLAATHLELYKLQREQSEWEAKRRREMKRPRLGPGVA